MIPIIGFYLQPSVGGRLLPYSFWREFAEIEKSWPSKSRHSIAIRRWMWCARWWSPGAPAISRSTPATTTTLLLICSRSSISAAGKTRIVGGLLGHWAVWTRTAVAQLSAIHTNRDYPSLLTLAQQVTDANAAFFDPANQFRGCIAGLHEILRRQGLLEGTGASIPTKIFPPAKVEEIDRVCRAYPHLSDDQFVQAHISTNWLAYVGQVSALPKCYSGFISPNIVGINSDTVG